ncbi:MAG: L-lactate permease [Opitutales bacterium]|nr:L-lactate permease [Opitutales bacterium]MCH8540372.1 L-lactate permease [Opitutales bacterium]
MLDFFLAALPILFLIVVLTKPRPLSSPLAFSLAAILALGIQFIYFGTAGSLLLASVTAGLLNALTPITIVLGAIFFFIAMEKSGAMQPIKDWLHHISPNPVAQLMIVGWSFMFLLEGASGFGTPAALAAPILVGLGFPALRVAALCLVFNAISTPFGAVGTPLWFGFEDLGLSEEAMLAIGLQTAVWQTGAAMVLPITALLLIVDGKTLYRNLPFAFLSVAFSVGPMTLLAFINYEFPTVVGGSVGLVLSILAAKLGIGLEKEPKTRTDNSPSSPPKVDLLLLTKALSPIVLTVAILLVTRVPALPFRALLTKQEGAWNLPLGPLGDFFLSPSLVIGLENIWQEGLRWSHAILYVPSFLPFFLSAALALWLFGDFRTKGMEALWETKKKITRPVLALFAALVVVNLLSIGADRAPTMVMGQFFAQAAGDSWVYLAPFLGALGSFFSGSTTISNLTFGGIQYSIAQEAGLPTTLLLALQCAGASMGNMACIHNIVAVCAVLGLVNKEGAILKTVAPLFLLHGFLLALLTLLLA